MDYNGHVMLAKTKLCVVPHRCRPDLTTEEREQVLANLMREISALWQTDELRRQRPTPVDGEGAQGCWFWRQGNAACCSHHACWCGVGWSTCAAAIVSQLLAAASHLYRLRWLSWVADVCQGAPGTADAADVGYAFGCIAMVSACMSMLHPCTHRHHCTAIKFISHSMCTFTSMHAYMCVRACLHHRTTVLPDTPPHPLPPSPPAQPPPALLQRLVVACMLLSSRCGRQCLTSCAACPRP